MVRLLLLPLVQSFPAMKRFNPTMVRLLPAMFGSGVFSSSSRVSIPQWCDCYQGKILGFGGRMRRNEGRVAVDLRLPEEPKGVDGK